MLISQETSVALVDYMTYIIYVFIIGHMESSVRNVLLFSFFFPFQKVVPPLPYQSLLQFNVFIPLAASNLSSPLILLI